MVGIGDQVSISVNNQQGKTIVEEAYQVSDTEFRAGRSTRDLQIEPIKTTTLQDIVTAALTGTSILIG